MNHLDDCVEFTIDLVIPKPQDFITGLFQCGIA